MTAFVVRRMCADKARYDSERQAQRALNGRGEDIRRHLHVYACPVCSGWHMGHRPRSGGHRCEEADGLSAAMEELHFRVIPFMRRSAFAGPRVGWSVFGPFQDHTGRWWVDLNGPTRAKKVRSNRNCPTSAAAVRDLVAKARASRWWAPHEIGGRTDA